MSKRFTDSRKWYDPWFRKLPLAYKLFWYYITDTCDHAGFWKVDIEMASFLVGHELDIENAIDLFNRGKERVQLVREDLWHLPTFIEFQYGELKPNNNTHIAIVNRLIKAGVRQGLPSPFVGVKDKEKDKEKDISINSKSKLYSQVSKSINIIIEDLNRVTSSSYKPSSAKTVSLIKARLGEGYGVEDFKAVNRTMNEAWAGTKMEQYLRPATLYNSEKFEGYLEMAKKKSKPTVRMARGLV